MVRRARGHDGGHLRRRHTPRAPGAGLASRAVAQHLHEARERGVPISALRPAALRPYRGLGSFVEHVVRLEDLPAGSGPLAVEPYAPGDLEGVRACYRRVASTQVGPIDTEDPTWWPDRIVGHWDPSETHRVVVARSEAGGIGGYLSYVHRPAEGLLDGSFDLAAKHSVWATGDALRSLLGYARGTAGSGRR